MKPGLPERTGKVTRAALLLVLLTAGSLFAAGCLPSITPQAQPTPRVLSVAVTPALQPLNHMLQDCTAAMDNTGLVALDTPAQALDLNKTPLALRWGAPVGTLASSGAPDSAGDYAAVLGQEELVVVVHPSNPLEQIPLEVLKAIFTGAQRDWKEPALSGEIHPWALPAGDDTEAIFDAAILGAPVSPRVTYTAPDPMALRSAIAGDAAAIGFLPRRWVNASVKTLPIAGIDPARLRQPILATSKTAPAGLEKSWLICLQARLKE